MLYLPDSNVLIYTKMAGMIEHRAALAWFTDTLNDNNSTLLLCETVVLSFLRICTNRKVFEPPLPFADAVKFMKALLERSNVQIYKPTAAHFVEVARFMKKHRLGGNLVMDIHLAVTAIQTGAVLVSRDKDFLKIPYLKTVDPLS
jgi:toxin-antitoxin system PIN domain toxin